MRIGMCAWWLAALVLSGCGSEPTPVDSGIDAAIDSGVDASAPDAAACTLACEGDTSCCLDGEGAPFCASLRDDPRHCGTCGVDCVATRRGDRCETFQCACGEFEIGCTGRFDVCCAVDGTMQCVNTGRDPRSCGECGRACDPLVGNTCEGGRCICADDRRGCEGTAADACCVDALSGFAFCVDTTREPEHCGACGRRCGVTERCIDGECIGRDAGMPDAGASAG